jgi:hypothetical protein
MNIFEVLEELISHAGLSNHLNFIIDSSFSKGSIFVVGWELPAQRYLPALST